MFKICPKQILLAADMIEHHVTSRTSHLKKLKSVSFKKILQIDMMTSERMLMNRSGSMNVVKKTLHIKFPDILADTFEFSKVG
jgi:hypothetical protein